MVGLGPRLVYLQIRQPCTWVVDSRTYSSQPILEGIHLSANALREGHSYHGNGKSVHVSVIPI